MCFETFFLNGLRKLRFINCFELAPPRPLDRHPTTYMVKGETTAAKSTTDQMTNIVNNHAMPSLREWYGLSVCWKLRTCSTLCKVKSYGRRFRGQFWALLIQDTSCRTELQIKNLEEQESKIKGSEWEAIWTMDADLRGNMIMKEAFEMRLTGIQLSQRELSLFSARIV